MPQYANLGGKSGVVSYQLGPESITVEFDDGSKYVYTNRSAGASTIQEMKSLAASGEGLNSYINRVVRKDYASVTRSYRPKYRGW